MLPITFHKATANDAELLTDMRILFAIELAGEQADDDIANLKKQMMQNFRENTENGTCISIIAACGEATAGIGSVHLRHLPGNFKNPSGKWGYIMNMYTIPKFRKQGICSRILELLQEEAQKVGVTAFELHATEKGEKVYLKHEFNFHHEPTLRKFLKQ